MTPEELAEANKLPEDHEAPPVVGPTPEELAEQNQFNSAGMPEKKP